MVVLFFALGSILASFYYCTSIRLLKGEDVFLSRSKCDHCNHTLHFYDLIPIFSFIFLKGKCRYCHHKINILNLILEIVLGLLFAGGYLYFGLSYDLYMYLIITSLLIIIFITDFKEYIILDEPLIIAIILISIIQIIFLGIKAWLLNVLSGVGLFIAMYLIKLLGDKLFKKESLGGGDIKFSFIMGLCLSFRLGLCALILSAFLALPYSVASLFLKKNNEVAFGPFLASSLFLVFLFTPKFLSLLNLIFITI